MCSSEKNEQYMKEKMYYVGLCNTNQGTISLPKISTKSAVILKNNLVVTSWHI